MVTEDQVVTALQALRQPNGKPVQVDKIVSSYDIRSFLKQQTLVGKLKKVVKIMTNREIENLKRVYRSAFPSISGRSESEFLQKPLEEIDTASHDSHLQTIRNNCDPAVFDLSYKSTVH